MPIINMSESKMRNGSTPKCEGEVHKNVCDGVYVHLSVCMCVCGTVLEYQLTGTSPSGLIKVFKLAQALRIRRVAFRDV